MLYVEQFTKFFLNALGGKDNVRNEFLGWDNFWGDISYILISSMQYAFASGVLLLYLYNHVEIFNNLSQLLFAALTPHVAASLFAICAFVKISSYENKINALVLDTTIFTENHIRIHAVFSTFYGVISKIIKPNAGPVLLPLTGLYTVFAVISSLYNKAVSDSIYKSLQLFGFVRKNESPPEMLVAKQSENQEESLPSIIAQTAGAMGGVALGSYFPFANNIIFSSLTAAAGAEVGRTISNNMGIESKNSSSTRLFTNK